MYGSETKCHIDATIASTHTNPAIRIQILTIAFEISAEEREYDLLVARIRINIMPWEIREPILEDMAQKHLISLLNCMRNMRRLERQMGLLMLISARLTGLHIDLSSYFLPFRERGYEMNMGEKRIIAWPTNT